MKGLERQLSLALSRLPPPLASPRLSGEAQGSRSRSRSGKEQLEGMEESTERECVDCVGLREDVLQRGGVG